MRLRRHEAGRSAHQRYLDLRREWRSSVQVRTVRRAFLAVAAIFLVFAAAPIELSLRLLAAACAGGMAVFWLFVGMSPRADRYARGAQGERRTEDVAHPLRREGWVIRHDLDGAYGNLDHVAIGPAGVFLLDTKNLAGQVAAEDSGAVVVRAHGDWPCRWDRIAGQTRRAAAGLHDTLAVQLDRSNFRVTPVVVIWAVFEARTVEASGVVFVHGDELVNWLRNQRPRYTPAEIQEFGQALNRIPQFLERTEAS